MRDAVSTSMSSTPAADGGGVELAAAAADASAASSSDQAGGSGATASGTNQALQPAAAGSAGSSSAAIGGGGTGSVLGTPRLPQASGPCPTLTAGSVRFGASTVQFWLGTQSAGSKGPLLVYWHGTGSNSQEATNMLGPAFSDILAAGGVIASLSDSNEEGTNTSGTGTWYSGDLAVADDIVACTAQQRAIDVARIYTAGCSSGGLQAGMMAMVRSEYVAAAMLNSGGQLVSYDPSDPDHVPPMIAAHGPMGTDVVIIDFSDASRALENNIVTHGGFAVDCAHEGGHCGATQPVVSAQWQFLQAHPYGVKPSPYANGLPASFPSICKISGR
jgi:poly(3-hydroxybutyrate) depolymerase